MVRLLRSKRIRGMIAAETEATDHSVSECGVMPWSGTVGTGATHGSSVEAAPFEDVGPGAARLLRLLPVAAGPWRLASTSPLSPDVPALRSRRSQSSPGMRRPASGWLAFRAWPTHCGLLVSLPFDLPFTEALNPSGRSSFVDSCIGPYLSSTLVSGSALHCSQPRTNTLTFG